MTDDDDDDPVVAEVHCCAGPPACLLQGDAAIEACDSGCVWCSHLLIFASGRECLTEPGHA